MTAVNIICCEGSIGFLVYKLPCMECILPVIDHLLLFTYRHYKAVLVCPRSATTLGILIVTLLGMLQSPCEADIGRASQDWVDASEDVMTDRVFDVKPSIIGSNTLLVGEKISSSATYFFRPYSPHPKVSRGVERPGR